MTMGTTLSLWRYDAARGFTLTYPTTCASLKLSFALDVCSGTPSLLCATKAVPKIGPRSAVVLPRRDHGVRGKSGRQAVDAFHVLEAPILTEVVQALGGPVTNEAASFFLVVEQGHAHAA